MTRNKQGQYTKKGRGLLPLILILAIMGVVLYFTGIPGKNTQKPMVTEQVAKEDPRFEAEFKAKENLYRLQSKLSVYEKDRLTVIEEGKIQTSRIETEYKKALAEEKDRYTKEIYKVNAQLDSVRKELLATSTVKSN
jgi:hypothetical protein